MKPSLVQMWRFLVIVTSVFVIFSCVFFHPAINLGILRIFFLLAADKLADIWPIILSTSGTDTKSEPLLPFLNPNSQVGGLLRVLLCFIKPTLGHCCRSRVWCLWAKNKEEFWEFTSPDGHGIRKDSRQWRVVRGVATQRECDCYLSFITEHVSCCYTFAVLTRLKKFLPFWHWHLSSQILRCQQISRWQLRR